MRRDAVALMAIDGVAFWRLMGLPFGRTAGCIRMPMANSPVFCAIAKSSSKIRGESLDGE